MNQIVKTLVFVIEYRMTMPYWYSLLPALNTLIWIVVVVSI